ncbi:MAG: 2-C-methyl-D-erythritol 2,4-cyclodiphosphate synthase, partial [Clostridia bacterium]|nr:2-C-methyl-D-erythritol 2,4-cyclodiphosphate synthase [Clostridia bacterium]
MCNLRIGHGYDVHKLVPNRDLILGGVTIPYEKGLLGHSDADVLIHAVCDSLLGALALGDIGKHFPNSDAQYAGIDSRLLLLRTAELIREKGWQIANIDATVIAEAPALSHLFASSTAFIVLLSQPERILTVTGTVETLTTS